MVSIKQRKEDAMTTILLCIAWVASMVYLLVYAKREVFVARAKRLGDAVKVKLADAFLTRTDVYVVRPEKKEVFRRTICGPNARTEFQTVVTPAVKVTVVKYGVFADVYKQFLSVLPKRLKDKLTAKPAQKGQPQDQKRQGK
jgi:hypothetical protein